MLLIIAFTDITQLKSIEFEREFYNSYKTSQLQYYTWAIMQIKSRAGAL